MHDRIEGWPRPAKWGSFALLVAVALVVALHRVGETGPLWPDSPRYTNGAAMIRDWVDAGAGEHPVRFAESNYRQYPAFSIPYHPPGYPAALAVAFRIFGETQDVARGFIALCWAGCGLLFLLLLREFGIAPAPAVGASLLFLTTPQLAMWSRDTMSEVPSLGAMLAGAWFWVRWCQGRGSGWLAGALAWAVAAFFCRITTAGVLPGWALYAVWSGKLTLRRALAAGVVAAAYLLMGTHWISFVKPYATFEFTADGKGTFRPMHIVEFFEECGGRVFLCGTLAAAISAVVLARLRVKGPAIAFWGCWFLSFLLFKAAVTTSLEPRHFFTAIPALAGLAAAGLDALPRAGRIRTAAAIVALGLVLNILALLHVPDGLVGYEAVGSRLAALERPGNVLLATPEDQELIFQLRAHKPAVQRQCIRSDRTLAVRSSDFAKQKAVVLATTPEDVIRTIRLGRIRYVVSFEPLPGEADVRPEEETLVHATALQHPALFREAGQYPLARDYVDYTVRIRGTVHVWEFTGDLPDGPSQLPTPIPTAGLVLGR